MHGLRIALVGASLFVSACSGSAPSHGVTTEHDAYLLLDKRLTEDRLYANMACIGLRSDVRGDAAVRYAFAAFEMQGEPGCPGDPKAAHLRDRFTVDGATGQVLWLDVSTGDYVPLERRKAILGALTQ